MKRARSARRYGVLACALGLIAGCGPETIELKDAPPVQIPQPQTEPTPPQKGGPAPGSSGSMNRNPGAST